MPVAQLERAGQQNTLEYRIVKDHMEALGKRRIPEIARGAGARVDEVQEALGRIARLEPRPGRAFLPDRRPIHPAGSVRAQERR